jgi:hypoxanthine phosphoribosyltransferase
MEKVKLLEKNFQMMIDSAELKKRIQQLASEIKTDFPDKEIHFVAVLNGVFMFAADLLREFGSNVYIHFIRVFSYYGVESAGQIHEVMGVAEDLDGKDVVILEDVIDMGRTVQSLIDRISEHQPSSLRVACLLFKRDVYKGDVEPDYVGFEIPNQFVIGYGLDYNGAGRNLPGIYCLSE